jgi:DNA-binding NarL/FixJ family response regulator
VQLEGYESVRLFVERARGRDPSFSLSPHNARAVAEICKRLEGIPLAIELAAARVGTLSVEQIFQRLTDSLKLLRGGSKTQMAKQRTLRGALDWSYELLFEDEKKLFGRLSVFAGGWTLEAAEAVGVGGGVEEDDVLDLLSGLVEKSLVVARERQESGVRYRMLEPVRQYASEKLEEEGEAEEARRRHADFFLALAEDAEAKLRGPEDREWLERLEEEHDNMRAALSWALEREEGELALRLAGVLGTFWQAHGHWSDGRTWLEMVVLAGDKRASVAARIRALEALLWLTYDQFELDRMEAVAQEAMELSAEAEIDSSLAASVRIMLACPAWVGGDYERAKELLEESLTLSREADDKVEIAEALFQLGGTTSKLGDGARAKEIYEEGLAVCREVGYTYRLPDFLLSLGYECLLEGDYKRGAALNEEAVAICREHGYRSKLNYALDNLGWAAILQDDHERARTSYQESLVVSNELGDKMIASESLEGLACISAARREALRAARLFGAAEALQETLREAVAYQHSPEEEAWREPYRATARSLLGEDSWEEAVAQGRAMSMEEAIEYALSAEEHSATTPSSPTSHSPPSSAPEHPAGLTSREIEVLGLVTAGMTSAQIAKELFLSPRTVETHITSIYHKIGVSSRSAATRFALEHGLA